MQRGYQLREHRAHFSLASGRGSNASKVVFFLSFHSLLFHFGSLPPLLENGLCSPKPHSSHLHIQKERQAFFPRRPYQCNWYSLFPKSCTTWIGMDLDYPPGKKPIITTEMQYADNPGKREANSRGTVPVHEIGEREATLPVGTDFT